MTSSRVWEARDDELWPGGFHLVVPRNLVDALEHLEAGSVYTVLPQFAAHR